MSWSDHVFVGLILILGLPIIVFSQNVGTGELKIIHINIGQGDATLILGPADNSGRRVSVLMDAGDIPFGGDKDGGQVVRAVLERENITALDYLILSHYDADHIGGTITGQAHIHGTSFIYGPNNVPGNLGDDDGNGIVDWIETARQVEPDPGELERGDDFTVLNFVDRGDTGAPRTQTYQKYVALASTMGQRFSITSRRQVNSYQIVLGDEASMQCVAGNGYVRGQTSRVQNVNTENEKSLCFLVTYGGFHYLIGGDSIGRAYGSENAQVEAAIGQYIRSQDINIDVLHVNHHGANNASATEFLNDISPEIAIISLGNNNSHGHAHDEALRRLTDAGVYRIYQTEWGATEGEIQERVRRVQAIFQGDIILTTDGDTFTVSTSQQYAVDE